MTCLCLRYSFIGQLKEDVRTAFGEMATVSYAEDERHLKCIDTEGIFDRDSDEEQALENYPPSYLGLVRLIRSLVHTFSSRGFDAIRESNEAAGSD